MYNDMLAKSTTTTNLDKDTWTLYTQRNSPFTGRWAPEEDQAPYFLRENSANKNIKKKYL
jgi:hypothetical protein